MNLLAGILCALVGIVVTSAACLWGIYDVALMMEAGVFNAGAFVFALGKIVGGSIIGICVFYAGFLLDMAGFKKKLSRR